MNMHVSNSVQWPTRDMLQIKKLLQIKSSCCKLKNLALNKIKCCKFKIVAANFQNELRQIKRMFLQVKAIATAWAIAFARWPIFKMFSFLEYLVFFGAVFCLE